MVYAASLTLTLSVLTFLWIKRREEVALEVMFSICCDQFKSFVMVIPKYFAEQVDFNSVLCNL